MLGGLGAPGVQTAAMSTAVWPTMYPTITITMLLMVSSDMPSCHLLFAQMKADVRIVTSSFLDKKVFSLFNILSPFCERINDVGGSVPLRLFVPKGTLQVFSRLREPPGADVIQRLREFAQFEIPELKSHVD